MARVRGSVNSDKNRLRNDKLLSSKKDIMLEEQTIGAFTLIFQDPNTEAKWQSTNLIRQIRLTQRLLFTSALFQGLFYWSDVVQREKEGGNDEHFVLFLSLRLLIGLVFIFGSFLIGTGLVLPNQVLLFWAQIFYGGPSIAIYCWTRAKSSQWDFLFLVYGLCFFTLPKMSPLNFIYAFSGAGMFSFLFIYISAFHLSLSEWILSSTYLLVIVVLFMYISYSSERSSRERWLLRQRLHREHIDLQIVVSSIEEDMAKAIEDRAPRRQYYRSSSTGPSRGPSHRDDDNGAGIHTSFEAFDPQRIGPGGTREKTVVLFFKGLAAWGLVMLMGFMFDRFNANTEREMSNSAPFVLLLHSTGFSIFLMYFTGQVRWFVLNGVMGLCMTWVFHKSGMNNRWIVFSTHSVGYVILATVVIIMILLFGGVVLVWTHLIDFVKEILTRYPQVKEDLNQERVLEQVLIRYLSDLPNISLGNIKPLDEESAPEGKHAVNLLTDTRRPAHNMLKQSEEEGSALCTPSSSSRSLVKVISHPKRPNACYFCLKEHPNFLLKVCDSWQSADKDKSAAGSSDIPLCTPYALLAMKYQQLTSQVEEMAANIAHLESKRELEMVERDVQTKSLSSLRETIFNLESALAESKRERSEILLRSREERNGDIERIISQHNHQLSELKRLHKISLAAERRRWEETAQSATSTAMDKDDKDIVSCGCGGGGGGGGDMPSAVQASVDIGLRSKPTQLSAVERKRSLGNRKQIGINDDTVTGASAPRASSALPPGTVNKGPQISVPSHNSTSKLIVEDTTNLPNKLLDNESSLVVTGPTGVPVTIPTVLTEERREAHDDLLLEEDFVVPPTPEDDDFNRFFLTSMNEIESIRLSLVHMEDEQSYSSGATTSRMKYTRELGTKN